MNMIGTTKKLLKAINERDYKLLLGQREFVSKQSGKIVKYFTISQANFDGERYVNSELYQSCKIMKIMKDPALEKCNCGSS